MQASQIQQLVKCQPVRYWKNGIQEIARLPGLRSQESAPELCWQNEILSGIWKMNL